MDNYYRKRNVSGAGCRIDQLESVKCTRKYFRASCNIIFVSYFNRHLFLFSEANELVYTILCTGPGYVVGYNCKKKQNLRKVFGGQTDFFFIINRLIFS